MKGKEEKRGNTGNTAFPVFSLHSLLEGKENNKGKRKNTVTHTHTLVQIQKSAPRLSETHTFEQTCVLA